METIGLYEPEELSLFGGEQLLLELGSPLEPDSPREFPDVGDNKKAPELLATESTSTQKLFLDTSNVSKSVSFNEEQPSYLDLNWLDTKLDLFNLLGEGREDGAGSNINTQVVPNTATVPHVQAELVPSTAEELFNQISLGLLPETITPTVPSEDCISNSLLSEVFNKLTSDMEEFVDSRTTDLSHSILSPVSVDDIESLLSGPVSPVGVTPVDSGLESLASSRPASPVASMYYSTDTDVCPSTSSPVKKSKRSKPYSKPPTDRKERKKMQNKTAALKYRQKKKNESESVADQCTRLEGRNKELKDKVDSMTREIQYLKDLMAEVVQAKATHQN